MLWQVLCVRVRPGRAIMESLRAGPDAGYLANFVGSKVYQSAKPKGEEARLRLVQKNFKRMDRGGYINCGKSALVFKARKGAIDDAVKVFDPEIVERFGRADEEERIRRELTLEGCGQG